MWTEKMIRQRANEIAQRLTGFTAERCDWLIDGSIKTKRKSYSGFLCREFNHCFYKLIINGKQVCYERIY